MCFDDLPCKQFDLNNNSLFIFHPDDEKPQCLDNNDITSQFQHGNVKVKSQDLSIALVFRHCTKSLMYNHITHKTIVKPEYIQDNWFYFETVDRTMIDYRTCLSFMENDFTDLVKKS